MLVLENEVKEGIKTVKDLKSGQFAIVKYLGKEHVVHVFTNHKSDRKQIISLSHDSYYWGDVFTDNLEVIKVLQNGDKLVVL